MHRHNLYAEISGTIITPLSLQPLHPLPLALIFAITLHYSGFPVASEYSQLLVYKYPTKATSSLYSIGAPPPSTPSLKFKMLIT